MLPAAQPQVSSSNASTGPYCNSTGANVPFISPQALKPCRRVWKSSSRLTCCTHAAANSGWHTADTWTHNGTAPGHNPPNTSTPPQHITQPHAPAARSTAPVLRKPQLNKVSAGWLTRQIKGCNTWAELEAIFRERGQQLNAVNLLAMLHQLTKADQQKRMVRFEDAARQTLVHNIVSSLLQPHQLPQLEVRGLANALWALGRLGISPGLANLNTMLGVMLPKLQQIEGCDPMSMSQCLWGLAKLGHRPSHAWMVAYLTATRQCLGGMTPQGLANVVWALATLQVAGTELQQFVQAFLSASRDCLQQHSPQALSNTIWALAELQVHPGKEWMREFFQVSSSMVTYGDKLSVVDVAQMLRGAAKMGGASQAWVHTMLNSSRSSTDSIGAQEFVTTLMALVLLRVPLPDGWLLHFMDRGHGSLRRMAAQEVSNVIWVLAQLGSPVKPSFARAWFKAAFSCMPYMNTQDCAQVVWSLGRLGWPVPERWMAAMYEESFKLIPSYSCAECAALIKGWALLQAWPDEVWMDRFYIDSLHLLPTCRSQELIILIASLSNQGCPRPPPQQWLQLWSASARPKLQTFNSMELVICVRALQRLKHVPDAAWTQALLEAINQAAEHAVSLQAASQQGMGPLLSQQLQPTQVLSVKEADGTALKSVSNTRSADSQVMHHDSDIQHADSTVLPLSAADAAGGKASGRTRRKQVLSEKRAAAAAAVAAVSQQHHGSNEGEPGAGQQASSAVRAPAASKPDRPSLRPKEALALQQALSALGLHVPPHLEQLCTQLRSSGKRPLKK